MPDITASGLPRYIAIADAIARDIATGRLAAGDRLPPQRKLAQHLGIDFTTVARGYVEAQARGLVSSTVGRGTFVTAGRPARPQPAPASRRPAHIDFSRNLPPEPDDPELLARMQEGLARIAQDLVPLLRYQPCGGAPDAKAAASSWLGRRGLVPAPERLFIAAGAQAALHAIFSALARPGELILAEALAYPGARALAAQLGIRLAGLPMDRDGIDPDALAEACLRLRPQALYLTPTLHNPTGLTMPIARRIAITDVARRFRLAIIEDDAYGFIPAYAPAPFAALAPELSWHVASLSKSFGAGLRCAYVVAPDARAANSFAALAQTATLMASPLTVALATQWTEDGTGDAILRFIRKEAAARQAIAAEILPPDSFRSDPLSFSLWLPLPPPWTRAAFMARMRGMGLGLTASDAFTVAGDPAEAVRICLGGPASRNDVGAALAVMAQGWRQAEDQASRG